MPLHVTCPPLPSPSVRPYALTHPRTSPTSTHPLVTLSMDCSSSCQRPTCQLAAVLKVSSLTSWLLVIRYSFIIASKTHAIHCCVAAMIVPCACFTGCAVGCHRLEPHHRQARLLVRTDSASGEDQLHESKHVLPESTYTQISKGQA